MVIFTQPDNLVVIDTLDLAYFLAETHKNRTMSPRHRLKKPIHNVKEACISKPYRRTYPANRYSSSLEIFELHRETSLRSTLVELIGIEPMT